MYLNSGFWQVNLCCQLIANMDIWVVSHLENLLKFLKLLSCECCPDSPFPFPLNCAKKERYIEFHRKWPQNHNKIQRYRNFCKLLCSWDGISNTFQRCTYIRCLSPNSTLNVHSSFQEENQQCPHAVLIPLIHCLSTAAEMHIF